MLPFSFALWLLFIIRHCKQGPGWLPRHRLLFISLPPYPLAAVSGPKLLAVGG